MRSNIIKLAALAVLGTISAPAPAQIVPSDPQGLTGFLDHIGGGTDIRLLIGQGASISREPAARFVGNQNVIGFRYFRTNSHNVDGFGDAKRALVAFNSECLANGGTVEADDSPVTKFQQQWASAGFPDKDPRDLVAYGAIVSVCTRGGVPTGGMVALVENHTDFVRSSPITGFLNVISPIPNRTAVYALKASAVMSQAAIDRFDTELAVRKAKKASDDQAFAEQQLVAARGEERRLIAWRKTVTIGTRTSCGLVIDQRGRWFRSSFRQTPRLMERGNIGSSVAISMTRYRLGIADFSLRHCNLKVKAALFDMLGLAGKLALLTVPAGSLIASLF